MKIVALVFVPLALFYVWVLCRAAADRDGRL